MNYRFIAEWQEPLSDAADRKSLILGRSDDGNSIGLIVRGEHAGSISIIDMPVADWEAVVRAYQASCATT